METTQTCEFLTPDELGLSQEEFGGLVQTLVLMEAGKIVSWHSYRDGIRAAEGLPYFEMTEWNERYSCGTVCCIGGTAEIMGNLPFGQLNRTARDLHDVNRPELYELFYHFPGSITVPHAAKALRGYLTTGRTNWTTDKE